MDYSEGIPLYSPKSITIQPGHQMLVVLPITLDIPRKHILTINSLSSVTTQEPHVCPGILDYHHHDGIPLVLANLYKHPITIKRGHTFAIAKLISLSTIASIHHVGDSSDLGLSDSPPQQNELLNQLL